MRKEIFYSIIFLILTSIPTCFSEEVWDETIAFTSMEAQGVNFSWEVTGGQISSGSLGADNTCSGDPKRRKGASASGRTGPGSACLGNPAGGGRNPAFDHGRGGKAACADRLRRETALRGGGPGKTLPWPVLRGLPRKAKPGVSRSPVGRTIIRRTHDAASDRTVFRP